MSITIQYSLPANEARVTTQMLHISFNTAKIFDIFPLLKLNRTYIGIRSIEV